MLKIKNLDMNDYNKIHENISQGIDKEALDQLCNKLGLDEGGDLAETLNALAGNSGGGSLVLACDLGNNYDVSLESGSKSDVASMFGITEEDVDRLLDGEFAFLNITSRKAGKTAISVASASEILVGQRALFKGNEVSFGLLYTDGAYSGGCSIEWPK